MTLQKKYDIILTYSLKIQKDKGGENMKNSSDVSSELQNIRRCKAKNEIFAKKIKSKLELEFIQHLNMAVNNIEEEIISKQFNLNAS